MTPDQLTQFKQALIKACDAHLATGGKIVSEHFGANEMLCPLNCLANGLGRSYLFNTGLYSKLGFSLSALEMTAFIYGFDDSPSICVLFIYTNRDEQATYQLGQELRQKYIKEKL